MEQTERGARQGVVGAGVPLAGGSAAGAEGSAAGALSPGALAGGSANFAPGCSAGASVWCSSKRRLEKRVVPRYDSARLVNMKTIAQPLVSFVRKFPAPRLPNTVELAPPPNTAPISAP